MLFLATGAGDEDTGLGVKSSDFTISFSSKSCHGAATNFRKITLLPFTAVSSPSLHSLYYPDGKVWNGLSFSLVP